MPSSKKNVKSKTNVKTNDENSSSIKETPKPVVESVEPSTAQQKPLAMMSSKQPNKNR